MVVVPNSDIPQVGGSSGHGSIALAKAFPELLFIVQDLATNIEDGRASVAATHPELASRIDFQAHDFFEPQPVRDADVYFLRMIIHDWPDSEAAVILRNTVQAMKPGARLVIMDTTLPAPGSVPATLERLLRLRDLTMMQAFNSKERSPEDWDALLAAVDPRVKLVQTFKPFGSVLSIMEWVVDVAEEQTAQDGVEVALAEHVESSTQEVVDVESKVEEVPAAVAVGA
jgi:6-hydroxytryprostatin B O-methyltransferase